MITVAKCTLATDTPSKKVKNYPENCLCNYVLSAESEAQPVHASYVHKDFHYLGHGSRGQYCRGNTVKT